jgi:predicted CXXCH cytochrome family protein
MQLGRLAILVGIVAGLGACTDEQIVYVNRPFNPPVDAVNGFLGYFDATTKQTACGNCHASFQQQWAGTAHADAWASLQASGSAQPFCSGCHSVSELGNPAVVAAGYNAVQDASYHDVQCESCHGAGFEHASLPDGVAGPLASIGIPQDLSTATNGCGECHQGTHHPFVEQWAESKHGYGGTAYLSEGGRSPCNTCHEGREAIRVNFNETTRFVEQANPTAYQPIVCAVCHDPHNAANEGQLRASLSEPSREQICVQCHSREGHPIPGSATRRGPHAAQGLLVIGEDAGWIPPNFDGDTANAIAGTHGTTANPRLCASCHVYMFDVNDASGNFVLRSVGHTFEAIGCLDPATGVPVPGPCSLAERNFKGCAVSGCHGTENAARAAFVAVRSRMNLLTDLLWTDTDNDSVLDPTDSGVLPQVLAQAIAANDSNQINLYDATFTPAEGAIWNAQLAFTHDRPQWSRFTVAGQKSCANPNATPCAVGSVNTAHKSSGEGVHNPFLLEALLSSSISYLRQHYGLPAPPMPLVRQFTPPANWGPSR